MFTKAFPALAILIAAMILSACSAPGPPGAPDKNAERVEIVLPMGEVEAGKQAFANLGCVSCHVVSGVDGLPPPQDLDTAVDLAKSVRGLSRSAIVTSIIAPAHVNSQATELWAEWSDKQRVWLGPSQRVTEAEEAPDRTLSRMTNYSNVMTVGQLADLAERKGAVEAKREERGSPRTQNKRSATLGNEVSSARPPVSTATSRATGSGCAALALGSVVGPSRSNPGRFHPELSVSLSSCVSVSIAPQERRRSILRWLSRIR